MLGWCLGWLFMARASEENMGRVSCSMDSVFWEIVYHITRPAQIDPPLTIPWYPMDDPWICSGLP